MGHQQPIVVYELGLENLLDFWCSETEESLRGGRDEEADWEEVGLGHCNKSVHVS
jgi:hypothetical protein